MATAKKSFTVELVKAKDTTGAVMFLNPEQDVSGITNLYIKKSRAKESMAQLDNAEKIRVTIEAV